MAIKHKIVKASGESGYATEWNDEHKIDSDIDFVGHSGVNLGEPIASSDIATKNYVDSQVAPPLVAPFLTAELISTPESTIANIAYKTWYTIKSLPNIVTTDNNIIVMLDAQIDTKYTATNNTSTFSRFIITEVNTGRTWISSENLITRDSYTTRIWKEPILALSNNTSYTVEFQMQIGLGPSNSISAKNAIVKIHYLAQ